MYSVENAPWQCPTVGGRKTFEVVGDVASGVKIWVGSSGQPLSFDKEFFADLLTQFMGREVRIGSKFDDPGPGSLGEWIQQKRGVKMNPAVYVAGLLVRLGYAEYCRRGHIRFFDEKQAVEAPLTDPDSSTAPAAGEDAVQLLVERASKMNQAEAREVLQALDQRDPDQDPEHDPFAALRGNPAYRLPTSERANRQDFEPLPLRGRPLSEDVIRDRR